MSKTCTNKILYHSHGISTYPVVIHDVHNLFFEVLAENFRRNLTRLPNVSHFYVGFWSHDIGQRYGDVYGFNLLLSLQVCPPSIHEWPLVLLIFGNDSQDLAVLGVFHVVGDLLEVLLIVVLLICIILET